MATTTLELTAEARPECLLPLRNLVGQLARDTGFSDEDAFAIKTCVGEAAANSVRHAYPESQPGLIKVSLCADDDELDVAVSDEGSVHTTRDDDDTLHLGIMLVTRLARHCTFTATPVGTTVEMQFSHPVSRDATLRAQRFHAFYP